MAAEAVQIVLHVVAALVAGGLIGLERSYHGRAAGFRTHTIVCMASAAVMLVTLYAPRLARVDPATVSLDPTRMAQGIMTGIGFLGAGVILKEGLSLRGLTTAASIWMTAGIGVLIGTGLYFAAALTTALTLGVLGGFRRIEAALPSQRYAEHHVRFERGQAIPEEELLELLRSHGFVVGGLSYLLVDGGRMFEYRMTLRTTDPRNYARLAHSLGALERVREFVISPSRG